MMVALEREINLEVIKEQIEQYRYILEQQMRIQGASSEEIAQIKGATVRNSIRSQREPEDVAWALLQ